MALNTIHIEFDPCEPTPASGYVVRYRRLGTADAYRNAGPFFTSPIVFDDLLEPAGSSFEGFIQGDCGGMLGVSVPWVAEFVGSVPAPSSEAPSSVPSSEAPSSSAPPPEFNELTVRHAEVEMTICGLVGFTAYLLAPATAITTGVTVYATPDLMDPLTGKSYIDDTTGPIYNIDVVTGLVGAPTGNAC